jgi:hypothetical protein
MEDLERLARRARAVPVAAFALMIVGFGVGDLSKRYIELPDETPLGTTSQNVVPRVHLDALSNHMLRLRRDGATTVEYVSMYQEHVEPVELVLRRRGVTESTARKIAWPLVQHSYERGLDPAFVVSILLNESGGKPTARSPVGARGLMQVMPAWSGRWRGCGRDLYEIDANLCNGTSILAWYLRRNPNDERKALLGYNGCVRGTNTPNCHTYPDKIMRLKYQIQREMNATRSKRVGAAAAP